MLTKKHSDIINLKENIKSICFIQTNNPNIDIKFHVPESVMAVAELRF